MARKPKPTRLQFGVRTAKRRAQPNEFDVTLKMEHDQCVAWYNYIHSELVKIAKVLESQAYPPGYVSNESHKIEVPVEVEAAQPTTTTTEV